MAADSSESLLRQLQFDAFPAALNDGGEFFTGDVTRLHAAEGHGTHWPGADSFANVRLHASQQEGRNECWELHSLNSVKVVVLLASQENLPLSFWNGQEAVSFG